MSRMQSCQAVGCPAQILVGYFMCRPHWYALPVPLRTDINAKWRARKKASRELGVGAAAPFIIDHVEACDEARRWTAEGEGRLADFTPDTARLKRLYEAAGREPKS